MEYVELYILASVVTWIFVNNSQPLTATVQTSKEHNEQPYKVHFWVLFIQYISDMFFYWSMYNVCIVFEYSQTTTKKYMLFPGRTRMPDDKG